MTWDEVLQAIEGRLSATDLETFKRRHRNFVGYPVEQTCRAFYDFAATNSLLNLLASYRFERLCRIAACLSPLPLRNRKVLELGSGGGHLAGFLREELGAEVTVMDWSLQTIHYLKAAGFKTLSSPNDADAREKSFDFIVCADSLGEVNSDEDSWLREPENAVEPTYVDELDQRYGFAAKLAAWKPLLAEGGNVLLFEPIGLPMFWQGAVASLRQSGWKAEILDPEPIWGLVATSEP